MVKWTVELSEYGIEFHPRPAIKAQVLADFVVELAYDEASISTPTWSLYADGSSTSTGSGAGVALESPQGDKFEYAIKLDFPSSNNEAEYEAFLAGGELALAAGVKRIVIYSDSQLVVNQVQGSYEARDEKMDKYFSKAKNMLGKFEETSVVQVSRANNAIADQLAKLASSMAAIRNRKITFISLERAAIEEPEEVICIDPTLLSWKEEIIRFLTKGVQPENKKDAKVLRRKASHFVMIDGELYKRDFSQPFLKCLTPEEGNYVLREIHEGVEAEPLAKISEKEVIKFLWRNIVCRFGIPRAIISNNGTQFLGNKLKEWCKGLAIKQFFTSVSNPQVNGQTKVTNRTILQHLKTRLGTAKRAWVDELPSVLWAYRTTPRTTTGETQFSLSYGTDVVAPAEVGKLNWRVKHYDLEANEQGLRMNLDFVEEVRERASVRAAMYKARMAKAYNSRVRPRNFQVGDLVMRKAEASGPIGKLDSKWEGLYKVTEIVGTGAYKLQQMDGRNIPRTWNIANLKKYYS
ncbi:hypothetical protein Sango_0084800 [Sesamum angolense]|uniref:Uncharacterized protein n=1 Tax=Sesamum angolense TaxID=2727404 RepID=A0AAE2C5T1_9LAMI|nr:hypothetical protein Sango_0084800 [Sesamum angolense]